MFRHTIVAVIALTLAACDESISPSSFGDRGTTGVTTTQTLFGTVVVNDAEIYLRESAQMTRLTGPGSRLLAGLASGQAEVRGSYDSMNDELEVLSFQLYAMGGLPAADGILVSIADGYGLRLATGDVRRIVDPPAELLAHMGERVWVSGPADGAPVDFGVIGSAIPRT